ncbi:META domain-containing protein [Flavobacterium sp. MR2016-29]|uniref:META domain-containing protein n=1 Tax=Flavobacterium sp. MR2016-29 TaxID=2783795 RepID=UPI00188D7BB2|nr:META domain-containing protein [Flavobacterium sp. MR2016-29]MBF4491217.1 META domain-containing protein [Flavobacterium sp. MR2016-29]
MKNYVILFISVLALFFNSCTTMKDTSKSDDLYNTSWELEYISGPRIAFEGLYSDKKPFIKFDKSKSQVFGNAGCNGYSAPFTLKGNSLAFGEQGPATMMFCEGGGEQTFLQMIKKIDSYVIDKDGKLNLLMNNIPMMRFKKVTK